MKLNYAQKSKKKNAFIKVILDIRFTIYKKLIKDNGQSFMIHDLCFYIFESLVDDDHFAIYNPPTNLVKF